MKTEKKRRRQTTKGKKSGSETLPQRALKRPTGEGSLHHVESAGTRDKAETRRNNNDNNCNNDDNKKLRIARCWQTDRCLPLDFFSDGLFFSSSLAKLYRGLETPSSSCAARLEVPRSKGLRPAKRRRGSAQSAAKRDKPAAEASERARVTSRATASERRERHLARSRRGPSGRPPPPRRASSRFSSFPSIRATFASFLLCFFFLVFFSPRVISKSAKNVPGNCSRRKVGSDVEGRGGRAAEKRKTGSVREETGRICKNVDITTRLPAQ